MGHTNIAISDTVCAISRKNKANIHIRMVSQSDLIQLFCLRRAVFIYVKLHVRPFVRHIFSFLAKTPVRDLIETWGFRVDLPLVFTLDPR